MFISGITDRGATPGLVATLAYTQARHKMIAENVANWQNPNYKTKRLDPGQFQQALARAFEQRGGDVNRPFALTATEQFHADRQGGLEVTPTERPTENVLFHDGTNMSIERQMSDLAENAMMHQLASQLLKGRYDGLRKAIRGRF
jgi:flagellar basal-body rod protein FlgB